VATPVNKLATGLLEFFGVKSGEWGPRELGQVLQPTLELGRWYFDAYGQGLSMVVGGPFGNLSAQLIGITLTNPENLSDGTQLNVPQTEAWIVLEADVQWTFTPQAGASASMVMGSGSGVAGSAGFSVWPMQQSGFVASDVAVARGGSASLLRPYWVNGGDRIQVRLEGIIAAAASVTVSSHMRFIRLRR